MKRFPRKYCCEIIKMSDQQDSTKYVWIFPDFATLLDFSWLCHSVDFSWLCHSVETKHNIFCRPNTMWRPRHQNKNTSWMFEILADGRQICGIIAGGHILHMCGCRDYKWLEGAYKVVVVGWREHTRSCREPFSMRTLHGTLHKTTAAAAKHWSSRTLNTEAAAAAFGKMTAVHSLVVTAVLR